MLQGYIIYWGILTDSLVTLFYLQWLYNIEWDGKMIVNSWQGRIWKEIALPDLKEILQNLPGEISEILQSVPLDQMDYSKHKWNWNTNLPSDLHGNGGRHVKNLNWTEMAEDCFCWWASVLGVSNLNVLLAESELTSAVCGHWLTLLCPLFLLLTNKYWWSLLLWGWGVLKLRFNGKFIWRQVHSWGRGMLWPPWATDFKGQQSGQRNGYLQ